MNTTFDTAQQILPFAALMLSPALIFWVWSRMTAAARARRVLRVMALITLACVAVLFGVTLGVYALCDGSQLKGFTNCRVIPVWLANLSTPLLLLIPVLGVGNLGALLFCAGLEWRARRVSR